MTLDTAVLADLAARATPGPWGHGFWSGACQKHEVGQHPGEPKCVYDWTLVHDADGETIFDNPHRIVSLQEPIDIAGNYDYEEGGIVKEADAAYVAAFSPDVALALLSEVETLRKALTGLLNQYTDDTGNFHDACDERECAVARAVAVARAALVSEEGSRTR